MTFTHCIREHTRKAAVIGAAGLALFCVPTASAHSREPVEHEASSAPSAPLPPPLPSPSQPSPALPLSLSLASVQSVQTAPSEPPGSEDASKPDAKTSTDDEGSFFDQFFDPQDGKLDFSKPLASGGFVPVPVIITEPAVDGGIGVMAQFISIPEDNPQGTSRTVVGGVRTGNKSWAAGAFRSGSILDNKVAYRIGAGTGKVTLTTFPGFAPGGIEYTNRYRYAVLGSAFYRLKDERFSLGPIIDFRKLKTRLEFPGLAENFPDGFPDDFGRTLTTGALGFGFHFDSRDNPVTPKQGINAFVEAKFNDGAFGSDRDFEIYDADIYAFTKIASDWRLAAKSEVDAAGGDVPSFFAPAIDLRGVQAARYQGRTAWSNEVEITHQLSQRWSVLAFAGYGEAYAGSSRFFADSGAVFAGGAGFRYRIARALGIDAGLDLAYGDDGAVFYIQFGHAWSFGMD